MTDKNKPEFEVQTAHNGLRGYRTAATLGSVRNGAELGRCHRENEMPGEADKQWINAHADEPNAEDYLAAPGKTRRETIGGTFTKPGYAEFDGPVKDIELAAAPDTIARFKNGVCVERVVPQAAEWLTAARGPENA